ncbi:response regulator [Pseudomonas sp. VE 196-7]|uniref:response regulator n=1 Tax=Pseudomonas sp. VE 196-7 TaxID=2956726 RepID=UPI002948C15F|nr:response regulator [Pseudomonas sp. VE 196-7]
MSKLFDIHTFPASQKEKKRHPTPNRKEPKLSSRYCEILTNKGWSVNVNWEGMLPIDGTVIVVEDDATLRPLMADILTEVGAQVMAFETADDALTYMLESHGKFPLVIVDESLPGQIQGIEFIEMAKERWTTVAAILTSGYLIDPTTLPRGTIYLHKPWSLDDLVVSVASLLQPGYPISRA